MREPLLALILLAAGLPAAQPPPTEIPPLPTFSPPGLLLRREQLPEIRRRLRQEPLATWWSELQARCRTYSTRLPTELPPRDRARIARDLALVGVLGDDAGSIARAGACMAALLPGEECGVHMPGRRVLEFSAEVAAAAEAHDLLTGRVDRTLHRQVRERLLEYGKVLEDHFPLWYEDRPDHWSMRQYSAMGLLCLALAPGGISPQQRNWWTVTWRELERTLSWQLDDDGGWAEGPGYLAYSLELYLGLAHALRRVGGPDLLAREDHQRLFRTSLGLIQPDGRSPNVDDACSVLFPAHRFTSVPSLAGPAAWLYRRQGSPPPPPRLLAHALLEHRPGVEPQPPQGPPGRLLPAAGYGLLRTGWDSGDTWLLLLAEHGRARLAGGLHEHPDCLSLSYWHGGIPMLVDGGLGDPEHHDALLVADSHSLILVNGEGPELWRMGETPVGVGTEAYLQDGFALAAGGGFMEGAARYAGVAITRQIWVDTSGLTLVRDLLRPAGLPPREYCTLWHAGTTELTLTERGGRFGFQDRPGLQVLVQAWPVGPLLATGEGLHSFTNGELQEHAVLRVTLPGAAREQLTLLLPDPGKASWQERHWEVRQGDETIRVGQDSTFALLLDGPGRGFALGRGDLRPRGLEGMRITVQGDSTVAWSRSGDGGVLVLALARPGAGPTRVEVAGPAGEQVLQLPARAAGAGPATPLRLQVPPPAD